MPWGEERGRTRGRERAPAGDFLPSTTLAWAGPRTRFLPGAVSALTVGHGADFGAHRQIGNWGADDVPVIRSHTVMAVTPNFQGNWEGPGGEAGREEGRGGEGIRTGPALPEPLIRDLQGSGAMISCLGEGGKGELGILGGVAGISGSGESGLAPSPKPEGADRREPRRPVGVWGSRVPSVLSLCLSQRG